jgi:ABC-type branched-subunit amino acid transport system substrate-binding protein
VRRGRWIALVAVAALAAAGLSVTAAGAQEDEPLEATDKGVTADTITVTVVAAVDVPGAEGLFQGVVDGVEAWAEFMNDNGGLAGRDVEVNFVDSRLSGEEARNAFIEACESSFALIGTSVLFLTNFDDLTECTDQAGQAVGLPDFPVVVTEVSHQCSPVSWAINPGALQCGTRDDPEQTYQVTTGPTQYYVREHGDLEGAFLYPSPAESQSAKNSQVPIFTAQGEQGIEMAYEQDVSALAPQSEYTPIASQIAQQNLTYAKSGLDYTSTVKLRREATLQSVTSVEVWDCSLQCYDAGLIEDGGADVEDQYVYMPFLPFIGENAETGRSDMLADFVEYVDAPDGFSVQGFSAGLFFSEVVQNIVDESGNNAVTRAAVIEEAPNVNAFTAGGMMGKTNVGAREAGPCFTLVQVQDGEFDRVFPKKKGKFNCKKSNVVELEMDLIDE